MAQAFHILKKDIRYLRLEIGLFLVLTAVYVLTETYLQAIAFLHDWRTLPSPLGARALLIVAGVYLIARLIHAESLPGDNQFWISRPYRWSSLLGEKLLFILIFINLPILAARLIVLSVGGFPLSWSLPGLLWSQFLILFVACLPVAALATLTTGLVPFVFSAIVIFAIGLVIEQMMVPPSLLAVRTLVDGVQWVWDALASLLLTGAAIFIVCVQYRKRRTRFDRTVGVAMAALAVSAYLYVPWPFALAVQAKLSSSQVNVSSIHAELIQSERRGSYAESRVPGVELDLPIKVSGVPGTMDAEADALAVSFGSSDGWTWKSGPYRLPASLKKSKGLGDAVFNGLAVIPRAAFNEKRNLPVILKASLYLTLFGNERSRTVPLQNPPVNVMDGLQCAQGPMNGVYCRSAFRWPARQVYAKSEDPYLSPFPHAISYSLFPADLGLDNIETDGASIAKTARALTIVTREPLAHIRLDFEAASIKMMDLVESPR